MPPGLAHGLCSNAEAQAGIDRDIEAPFLQLVGLDPRRLAKLDHVGEQGLAHFPADAFELGLAFGRFDEDDIGARLYEEAGADVIFVESPESEDELERIGREVSKPLLANMVEFGKTPRVETDRLKKWGFDIAIYPGLGFSVAAEAMRQGWQHLKDKGTSVGMNVPQFSGMHELMGFPEVWEFEKKWAQ